MERDEGAVPSRRILARRRRANVAGGRTFRAHQVKVTADEEARLVVLAERARVSVPRLLLESTLEGAGVGERSQVLAELFRLHREVSGIAINVNQLAAKANATDEFPGEARALRGELRAVCARIDETLALVAGGAL